MASTILTDLAQQAGALAAICAALGVLSRLKPVRWTWGKLVSGPLAAWIAETISQGVEAFHRTRIEPSLSELRDDVREIRAELKTNDGSTLRDAIKRTEEKADLAVAYAQRTAEAQGWPPGMDPTERPARPASP